MNHTIRIELPAPLLRHASIPTHEVPLEVEAPITLRSVLNALEAAFPALRGTIRDHTTQDRRPFIRFFACEEDLSHQSPDDLLPTAVIDGREPLIILGAIAGG
jgi:sulfur-carrier protein